MSEIDGRLVEMCLSELNAYIAAVRALRASLSEDHPQWLEVWHRLQAAKGALKCPECRRDETTHGPRVLALIHEVEQRWDNWQHPCHCDLGRALEVRLTAPPRDGLPCQIQDLRFTQRGHSEVFRHGRHAGRDIEWLVAELEDGRVSTSDPSMLVHAVFFHGALRALNNRHAVALVRYQHLHRDPMPCSVRVWPLLRGLILDDGSRKDVTQKFLEASRRCTDGRSIKGRSRSPSSESRLRTRVREVLAVHVRNIDFQVGDDELRAHLLRQGHRHIVHVQIERRTSGRDIGRSEGHALVTCDSAEAARRLADSGLPPLRGRDLLVRLDTATSAASPVSAAGSAEVPGGCVRCRRCGAVCGHLMDAYLIEGMRPPGPGYAPHTNSAYYVTCAEKDVLNCRLQDHPERNSLQFKLMLVNCMTCGTDLGNIQDATCILEDDWCSKLGERVMCFKCSMVFLELPDCSGEWVEVKKWSILYSALGWGDCRLSALTMQILAPKLRSALSAHSAVRNSNRDIRLVPRNEGAVPK